MPLCVKHHANVTPIEKKHEPKCSSIIITSTQGVGCLIRPDNLHATLECMNPQGPKTAPAQAKRHLRLMITKELWSHDACKSYLLTLCEKKLKQKIMKYKKLGDNNSKQKAKRKTSTLCVWIGLILLVHRMPFPAWTYRVKRWIFQCTKT